MPRIELQTESRAPREICFDLARDIDWHVRSATATREQAVAGVTHGLIGLGQEVTWRARHFGIWQHLTSRIVAFDPPRHFRDSMVSGAFARMDHDHFFDAVDGRTLMRDVFDFTSPLGPLGRVADAVVLTRHMRAFLRARNQILKVEAEARAAAASATGPW